MVSTVHTGDDVERAAKILTFDVTEHAPLQPGSHIINTSADHLHADIIDKRFSSNAQFGRILLARFTADFCLIVNDRLWAESSPFEAEYRGDGLYALTYRLSGNCLESVNCNSYPLGALTSSMVHYAQGVKHIFRVLAGEPLVEVGTIFRASLLMQKFGMTEAEVASLLNPPRQHGLDPWFNQCEMTPQMEAVARELRASSPLEKTWRLTAEAKTLELIALYLKQLEAGSEICSRPRLSDYDRRRLYIVREYLGKYFSQSPRIADLCRLAGFNRRKLMEGFKAEFGRTIHEYIHYMRMEQAGSLLEAGRFDISQVAQHVGYGYQGNFSKAFKQYFGVAPRHFASARGKAQPRLKPIDRGTL